MLYDVGAVARPLKHILGDHASIVVMVVFFLLTGLATFAIRHNRDFIFCCAPAIVAIPLWTYGQSHDRMILLPVFILWTGRMFAAMKFDKWKLTGCLYLAAMIPEHLWHVCLRLDLLDSTDIGWKVYRSLELASSLSLVLFVLLLIRDEMLRRKANPVEPLR